MQLLYARRLFCFNDGLLSVFTRDRYIETDIYRGGFASYNVIYIYTLSARSVRSKGESRLCTYYIRIHIHIYTHRCIPSNYPPALKSVRVCNCHDGGNIVTRCQL